LTPAAVRASRWLLPVSDPALVAGLARELRIGMPAARVLFSRGYRDAAAARRFLSPELGDLHDPFLLRDMDAAVERLLRAISEREKILLYGDYDVDGTSAVVVLKKAIDLAGGSVDFFVPHRLRDGYGMRPEAIDRAAADGVKLVVSVDTGIRAGAVVEHARGLGIDVIVTDHHLPEATLPPAVAVINPNRRDCEYPEKNLCGAAVAFKIVQALFARMGWPSSRVQALCESFLKLVAVATVADVVPLTGENRVIVKRGLNGFHTVRNPGLRALLHVAGFQAGDCPSAGQVAFRIAPRINAAGRMADAIDVIEMFLTDDSARALELAAKLHDLNRERQDTEADIVRRINEECERVAVTDAEAALVFSGAGWHKGVVGIVASRIVERYHRPVFVLCEDEETGLAQGSGRSIPAFHLLEALESMRDLFMKFGGHKQAAGVTLRRERVQEFRERFNRYTAERLTADDFRPAIEFDAEIDLAELNDDSACDVLRLAPFGCGNPAPLFALRAAELAGPPQVREKLVKVAVRQGGRTMFFKSWNNHSRWQELAPGTALDLAVCIEDDTYGASRGLPGWSAAIKDFRIAHADVESRPSAASTYQCEKT
jgi:single-stranded-DNA-specific exonuclease